MKTIARERLGTEFAEQPALFFTPEGIIVDSLRVSPLLPVSKTIQKLGCHVLAAYSDEEILLVSCQLPSLSALETQFQIVPPQIFLQTPTDQLHQQILKATHWLSWDRTLQYCSQCGGRLEKITACAEKKCSSCQASFFPNLAPAVMILIQRDNEILLARSAHFKPGVYSALAGFIDLGETAEAAANREVKEEVGVEISDLVYFGSQSWPFPGSFMMAFKAQYLSGDLKIDDNEIEDARWFSVNHLPELPPHSSISRQLIDTFVASRHI